MSRSYRKNYILKDTNKFEKKHAKRITRRKLNQCYELPKKNNNYKRLYDSHKVCEYWFGYKSIHTWKKHQLKHYSSVEECLRDFNRSFKCK